MPKITDFAAILQARVGPKFEVNVWRNDASNTWTVELINKVAPARSTVSVRALEVARAESAGVLSELVAGTLYDLMRAMPQHGEMNKMYDPNDEYSQYKGFYYQTGVMDKAQVEELQREELRKAVDKLKHDLGMGSELKKDPPQKRRITMPPKVPLLPSAMFPHAISVTDDVLKVATENEVLRVQEGVVGTTVIYIAPPAFALGYRHIAWAIQHPSHPNTQFVSVAHTLRAGQGSYLVGLLAQPQLSSTFYGDWLRELGPKIPNPVFNEEVDTALISIQLEWWAEKKLIPAYG